MEGDSENFETDEQTHWNFPLSDLLEEWAEFPTTQKKLFFLFKLIAWDEQHENIIPEIK